MIRLSINVVVISGNLTREPELRTTTSGSSILNIGVAVNDRRKNAQTGEWEDYANFVDCVMFGNRAESLSRILRKGMMVSIQGKLRYSSWDDKEGHRRSKIEVVADDIVLPPRGQQGQQQGGYAPQPPAMQSQYQQPPMQQPQYQQPPAQQPPMQQPPMQQQYQQPPAQQGGFYDEDIPF